RISYHTVRRIWPAAVEQRCLHQIGKGGLHNALFVARMVATFFGSDEASPHPNSACAQGERSSKSAAIRDTAGRDHGDASGGIDDGGEHGHQQPPPHQGPPDPPPPATHALH